MLTPKLKNMDVGALLELRAQVDSQLTSLRSDLQKQLEQLPRIPGASTVVHRNGRSSAMKGAKVEPKYRDVKTGETWAGRGLKPRWLTAALKSGKKLDDFLIDKSARKAMPKGRRKRK